MSRIVSILLLILLIISGIALGYVWKRGNQSEILIISPDKLEVNEYLPAVNGMLEDPEFKHTVDSVVKLRVDSIVKQRESKTFTFD